MSSSYPHDLITPTLSLDASNSTENNVSYSFEGTNYTVSFESQIVYQTNMIPPLPDSDSTETTQNILIPVTKAADIINGTTKSTLVFTGNTPFTILESDKFQTKPLYIFVLSKGVDGTLLQSINGDNNWKIIQECNNNIKIMVENSIRDSSGNLISVEPFELTHYDLNHDQCKSLSLTTIIFNENNISVFKNGSLLCSTSANTRPFLGANNSISINCSGNIYELMMYNSELSVAELQRVEGYLAWKWSCETLLPASHSMSDSSSIQNISKIDSNFLSS